jgi:hypothetical protein
MDGNCAVCGNEIRGGLGNPGGDQGIPGGAVASSGIPELDPDGLQTRYTNHARVRTAGSDRARKIRSPLKWMGGKSRTFRSSSHKLCFDCDRTFRKSKEEDK